MSIKIDIALVNNKLIGIRMISITTHIIEHINKSSLKAQWGPVVQLHVDVL